MSRQVQHTNACPHCGRRFRTKNGLSRHSNLCAEREPLEREAHLRISTVKSRRGSSLRREGL